MHKARTGAWWRAALLPPASARWLFSLASLALIAWVAALPLSAFFGEAVGRVRSAGLPGWLKQSAAGQGVCLALSGVACLVFRGAVFDAVALTLLFGLTVLQLVLSARRLLVTHGQVELSRGRLGLTAALFVASSCVLVRPQAAFLVGSLALATVALTASASSAVKALDARDVRAWRILHAVEAVLAGVYGLSFLVIPESMAFAYAVSVGIALIVDGIARIGLLCREVALRDTMGRLSLHARIDELTILRHKRMPEAEEMIADAIAHLRALVRAERLHPLYDSQVG